MTEKERTRYIIKLRQTMTKLAQLENSGHRLRARFTRVATTPLHLGLVWSKLPCLTITDASRAGLRQCACLGTASPLLGECTFGLGEEGTRHALPWTLFVWCKVPYARVVSL